MTETPIETMNFRPNVPGFERRAALLHFGPCCAVQMQSVDDPTKVLQTVALVDTGAETSGIGRSLVAKLGLKASRTIRTSHATGYSYVGVFPMRVSLLTGDGRVFVTLELPEVSEFVDADPRWNAILGRDVLGHFLFGYDGRRGTFFLSTKET